jgi:hypothetical protein
MAQTATGAALATVQPTVTPTPEAESTDAL